KAPAEVIVTSAGTQACPGALAAQHAVTMAHRWGIDLQDHAAQILNCELLDNADHYFVMSYDQAFALREYFGVHTAKIHLLGAYDPQSQNEKDHEILDPYGGSMEAYETCANKIQRSIDGLATAIEKGLLN